MRFTFARLEALWIAVGGPPGWAPLMAGIAFSESSGTPTEVQPTEPASTTGWGLWQLTPGTPALLTPVANARAALAKFEAAATPLDPWTDDATWTAWNAAGRPAEPTLAQVKGYLASWGWVTTTPGLEVAVMGCAVGTGRIVVDGVTAAGHKVVFSVPVDKASEASAWSIMDLSDAAKIQGVAGATSFTS